MPILNYTFGRYYAKISDLRSSEFEVELGEAGMTGALRIISTSEGEQALKVFELACRVVRLMDDRIQP